MNRISTVEIDYPKISIVWIDHNLFIHSSIRHLSCFHPLAIVNNLAINTGVQVSALVLALNSFGCMYQVELLGHVGIPCLTF